MSVTSPVRSLDYTLKANPRYVIWKRFDPEWWKKWSGWHMMWMTFSRYDEKCEMEWTAGHVIW
jgi:hypothetical protein